VEEAEKLRPRLPLDEHWGHKRQDRKRQAMLLGAEPLLPLRRR
jgi:hypothetical protein